MIRRVESRVRRVVVTFLALLLASFVMCAPVGILGSSNLVWGEDDQYGKVKVPGHEVLHLPAGTVDVNAAVDIPGKGNATVDLPLPSHLSLAVAPVGGASEPVVTRSVGTSTNANANDVNTQRRVWHVRVQQSGDYRVAARGNFLGIGLNPQLWFGHGPPLPGTLVPAVAAALVLIGWLVWFVILPRVRPRRPAVAARTRAAPSAASDEVTGLEELAGLHRRGELTDAEFTAAKAKLLDSG
ncbi:MAG: hypothetical protein QOG63_1685 [Thermoleophilaceae bacterium]|nr:hypothetical protein [Thermoleophilaceae bacterium]